MTNSVNGKWLRLSLRVSATAIAGTFLCGKLLAQAVERPDLSLELIDPKVLRVCADPHNMPFSTERGEGFENKLADASMAARAAPSRVSTAPQPINLPASPSVHHGVEVGISAGRVKRWHAANRRIRHHSPANSDSCSTGWPNTS